MTGMLRNYNHAEPFHVQRRMVQAPEYPKNPPSTRSGHRQVSEHAAGSRGARVPPGVGQVVAVPGKAEPSCQWAICSTCSCSKRCARPDRQPDGVWDHGVARANRVKDARLDMARLAEKSRSTRSGRRSARGSGLVVRHGLPLRLAPWIPCARISRCTRPRPTVSPARPSAFHIRR
jgi:hypothetical protein